MPFKEYNIGQYNKAINLKKKGLGSQRIAKILGIKSRNAVEGWINQGKKPYHFSEKRIEAQNSKENIERMRRMNQITQPKACKISAELRTKRLSEIAKKLSKELAYALGVIYGGGHVSVKQRRIVLGATDKEFAEEFKRNLEKWSGFKAMFYLKKQTNLSCYIKSKKPLYTVYIDSKEASEFIKNFDINIIKKASIKVKSAFLKGLYDSDGSILKIGFGVSFYNTDFSLILLIRELLRYYGISSTITESKTPKIGSCIGGRDYYKLSIYKKENILKYYDFIGFTIQRKLERLITKVNSIY